MRIHFSANFLEFGTSQTTLMPFFFTSSDLQHRLAQGGSVPSDGQHLLSLPFTKKQGGVFVRTLSRTKEQDDRPGRGNQAAALKGSSLTSYRPPEDLLTSTTRLVTIQPTNRRKKDPIPSQPHKRKIHASFATISRHQTGASMFGRRLSFLVCRCRGRIPLPTYLHCKRTSKSVFLSCSPFPVRFVRTKKNNTPINCRSSPTRIPPKQT